MKKKKIGFILVIIFGLAQVFQPQSTSSEYNAATDFIAAEKPAEEIKLKLKTSCYDCHSGQTNYPWYANITPVNYWINGHIKHAKGHLNFSTWTLNTPKEKVHQIKEMIVVLKKQEMPLPAYTKLHADASFSKTETEKLMQWLIQLQIKHELAIVPVY